MERSVWEELLGSFAKCVRGAVLISTDGQVMKTTLSQRHQLALDTQWIATQTANKGQQLDIKTDSGWILAAPVNKQQVLVVVIESGPYTRFNLDLIRLFADGSASSDDSRLADPIIGPQSPKQGGTHAITDYKDAESDLLEF
jgi:predicted regulator of Ras-like GTPase activity (Roadblock/LC7/MglB family)